MKRKLLLQACTKFAAGVLLVGCLLFLPAGTVAFWKGWLLMAALFFPMLITGIILWVKAPELLEKRLNSKPLLCGSVYAFLIFLIYPFLLIKRIKNEEALLLTGLEGYAEYTRKVRYRLVPFIW